MRVLITGMTCQIGSHLVDFLVEMGNVQVFGTYRLRDNRGNVKHLADRVTLLEMDLENLFAMLTVLNVPCLGCYKQECEKNCMELVSPASVFEYCKELLGVNTKCEK